MPTEDRSLDALKEEGTATVIDGSDDECLRQDWQRLYSINEGGQVPGHFLYIDGYGLLRTDGTKTNKANEFKVHIIDSKDGQVVMLEHKNTQKVVAIDADNDTVIAKRLPSKTTLEEFTNLETAAKRQPDILFYKIPGTVDSCQFYLKSYQSTSDDDQRVLGFNPQGRPKPPSVVKPGEPASLFKLY